MGLTTWKDAPVGKIQKFDVVIAKNYLTEHELAQLSRLVNAYLDVAEDMALRTVEGVALQVRLDGDHAAADVHAHGVGHHCGLRLQGAAHGRAEPEMGVGHQRQVALDDGHAADPFGLAPGGLIDNRGPGLNGALSVFVLRFVHGNH